MALPKYTKTIDFEDPNGKLVVICETELLEFCKEENLHYGMTVKLRNGTIDIHRGWKKSKIGEI
jgi:hypothetical protein